MLNDPLLDELFLTFYLGLIKNKMRYFYLIYFFEKDTFFYWDMIVRIPLVLEKKKMFF